MTIPELRKKLLAGYTLDQCFDFVNGQDCLIYKAEQFNINDRNQIVYIPDIYLNELYEYTTHPVQTDRAEDTDEIIDDILSCCYTVEDFITETHGNVRSAYDLFCYVDWQHPSSAVPELHYGTITNAEAKELWLEFGDVPMNPETECIEEEWNGFPVGTNREDIWEWFDDVSECGVYKLMYQIDTI